MCALFVWFFFFFKQKTAYEMRISDWSSDVCSSDLAPPFRVFLEVTLPLSMPGLAAGGLLCFVLGSGTYVTPMILGGPSNAMFAQLIYNTIIVQLDWPMGAAMSMLLLILLTGIVMLYNRFVGLGQVYKSLAS